MRNTSVVSRQDKQPRPDGFVREVSDDFRKRLVLKVEMDGTSAREIVHLLERSGVKTNESTISNLRKGRYPTSRLVEPICKLFGWPIPPLPGQDSETGEVASKIMYLRNNNKENYEKIMKMIDAAFEAQRLLDTSSKE